jgi:hypothetical protein
LANTTSQAEPLMQVWKMKMDMASTVMTDGFHLVVDAMKLNGLDLIYYYRVIKLLYHWIDSSILKLLS